MVTIIALSFALLQNFANSHKSAAVSAELSYRRLNTFQLLLQQHTKTDEPVIDSVKPEAETEA